MKTTLKVLTATTLIACVLAAPLAGYAADEKKDKKADAKAGKVIPYPLTTCLVQDEKLDDKPFVFVYQGHEIKFCCDSCKPDFEKDPAKYMKKLAELEKKQKK